MEDWTPRSGGVLPAGKALDSLRNRQTLPPTWIFADPLQVVVDLRAGRNWHKARLNFQLNEEGDGILSMVRVEGSESAGAMPTPSDAAVNRLTKAAQIVLDLDGESQADFEGGQVVRRLIPADPPPYASEYAGRTPDEVLAFRPSSVQLIRPLLAGLSLQAELLPYQMEGVAWLVGRPRGILADDMGLGKTLQALASVARLVESGEVRQAIVVAPRSLLVNWGREISRWTPALTHVRVTPTSAHREKVWEAVRDRAHVCVTNYEQLRSPPESLRRREIDLVIADEAHRLRNLGSQTSRGIQTLIARRFWALTGTPIERDAFDLASLLAIIDPGRFARRDGAEAPGVLRSRARPYVLRRLKAEVLNQLPPVIDRKEILELTPAQTRAYRRAIASHRGTDSYLVLINELRSIADYDPVSLHSAKVERILEILTEIRLAGEKAVVFSYLLKPLELLGAALKRAHIEYETVEGSMDPPERSAALDRFRSSGSTVVLLGSLRVAGEGVNLTEANHVIFFNEWWNPSSNLQARDRVVRIGQKRGVAVWRFRMENTIEQVLDDVLEEKQKLMLDVVDALSETEKAINEENAELVQRILGRAEHLRR